MANVLSAEVVKELRDVTGAGMMDCKQALVEANGDIEQAKDLLRKKGLASANKRANREAKDGIIFLQSDSKKGVMLELNCETDFVAKTDDFTKLGNELLALIGQKGESVIQTDAIQTKIQEVSGKTGEKIASKRSVSLQAANGFIASYKHHNSKIGILIQFETSKPELNSNEEVQKTAKDIAMQVAALRPQFLKPSEIDPAFLEREKAIFRDQVKDKPANVQDKIIQGKLEKRYEEVCLLNQKSVIDNSKSISQILETLSQKLGGNILIKSFKRFEIGFE